MNISPNGKVLATIVLVLFCNIFVYHRVGPLALTLMLLAIGAFVVYVHTRLRTTASRLLAACAVFAAATLSLRSDAAVMVFSALACISAGALLISTAGVRDGYFSHLSELILSPLRLFLADFEGAFTGWTHILTRRNSHSGTARSLLVGLVVGIPVVLVLTGMLSQADPIFARYTGDLFSGAFVNRLFAHLFWSCLVFLVFLPVAFIVIRPGVFAIHEHMRRLRFSREMSVVLFLVCAVMGAFLVIEWPYIFVRVAAETDLSVYGVATYSEYVKRGFAEFIVVSVLLYGISWAGLIAVRGSKENSLLIRILQFLVLTEAGLFILSVFRRIILYVQFHGLTLGRVYGGCVLAGVSVLFFTLAGRMVLRRWRWVAIESAALAVLFVCIALTNAEHAIATRYPPTVNGSVDYVYLSRLSADGVAGWKLSYDHVLSAIDRIAAEKQTIIPRDMRTQVFYSGVIIRQILQNYHRLTLQYASPSELKEYVQSMYLARRRAIDTAMPDIARRASDEKKAGMDNGAYVILQKKLSEELIWLDRQSKTETTEEAAFRIRISGFGVFQEDSVPVMYIINTDTHPRVYDRTDRFFLWNYSDARAYDALRRSIPLPVLLLSASEYFSLQERISRQPLSEQDHAPDSSFDGPFLSPL